MKTFLLVISSPDGDKFRESVVNFSVRGVEGELAILAGHIPFVTTVKPCECKIELENGDIITGHTDGGILTVGTDKVAFLSGSFKMNE